MVVAAHSCIIFCGKLLLWLWSNGMLIFFLYERIHFSFHMYFFLTFYTRFIDSMWMRGNIFARNWMFPSVSLNFGEDFFLQIAQRKKYMFRLLLNAKCLFLFGSLSVGYNSMNERKKPIRKAVCTGNHLNSVNFCSTHLWLPQRRRSKSMNKEHNYIWTPTAI